MTHASVPLAEITRAFGRIGLLSFGGPAAQIALMHRTLVEEKRWMTEDGFLRALSFCMLLPGPEAMQLATYAGWRLRGVPGGVIAGGLFVLPGAVVIATLALLYVAYGTRPDVSAALLGLQAAVIVIVIQALWRLSAKALRGGGDIALALGAFVAIFAFVLPFPLIIAVAAAAGALRADASKETPAATPGAPTRPTVLIGWVAAWLAPLAILWALDQHLLFELAAFFAWLAVVTFGGAYAVLAYMAQEVVQNRGWLDPAAMVDALGLAETTPGPLILVLQFVGQLVGHQAGGVWFGLLAAGLTLWMTFVPCFLWIFAGAPYVETLTARPRLKAALAGVTAAVVGVILNLSLWFAVHVVFDQTAPLTLGPVAVTAPVLASVNPYAIGLIVLCAGLLWRARLSVPAMLAIAAGVGWALGAL